MVMSYVLSLDALEQLLIALRAHTRKVHGGLDFSESYDKWQSSIEEPFVAHLTNDIFCKGALLLFACYVLTIPKHAKIALPVCCLNGQSETHLHRHLLRAAACLLKALLVQPLLKKW